MANPIWITWLLFAAGLAGIMLGLIVVLCAMGLDRPRGRRRCPKCWYSLAGTPGRLTCSECGFVAASERQLQRTRRHWRWAALGAALIAFGIGGSVWQGRGIDWQPIKPAWWLAREARSPADLGVEARRELVRRIESGRIGARGARRLAGIALGRQVDPNVSMEAWYGAPMRRGSGWGDLIETARDAGHLDDESWHRYLRQMFSASIAFELIPPAGSDEPVRVEVAYDWPRTAFRRIWPVAPDRGFSLYMVIESAEPFEQRPYHDSPLLIAMTRGLSRGSRSVAEIDIGTTGRHELNLELRFVIVEAPPAMRTHATCDDLEDALLDWTETYSFQVEIPPAADAEPPIRPTGGR